VELLIVNWKIPTNEINNNGANVTETNTGTIEVQFNLTNAYALKNPDIISVAIINCLISPLVETFSTAWAYHVEPIPEIPLTLLNNVS
jgi:hypothetical protein